MAKFEIGAFAKSVMESAGDGPRDIETITGEILALKEKAGTAILDIGRRLIDAKALLPHGEWLPWLTERVEFSERSAQRRLLSAFDKGAVVQRLKVIQFQILSTGKTMVQEV